MIFDGKKFAEEIISKLPRKKAKLAVFLSDDNIAGRRYVKIKTEVAKRLGVEIIMNRIDGDEDGIIVQLPHPDSQKLISQIPKEKDVDGLRGDSPYLPAVVLAVQKVLITHCSLLNDKNICVVGANGFVGSKLMQVFPAAIGMDKENFDAKLIKNFDIVISATGIPGLIKDVKRGAVCIDVGYPEPEFSHSALAKASFYTPVPGGLGPVTVACLFQNLLNGI